MIDTHAPLPSAFATKSRIPPACILHSAPQRPTIPLVPFCPDTESKVEMQLTRALRRHSHASAEAASASRVRYSHLTIRSETNVHLTMPPESEDLNLGPFVYSRAQGLRVRLTKAEAFGREVLVGYITDLHKDRPRIAAEQSRQITMEVKYGAGFRKVTMRLLPTQYRTAVVWHDSEVQVRLDAVFDKRGRPWTVAELRELTPVDPSKTSAKLFDGTPP